VHKWVLAVTMTYLTPMSHSVEEALFLIYTFTHLKCISTSSSREEFLSFLLHISKKNYVPPPWSGTNYSPRNFIVATLNLLVPKMIHANLKLYSGQWFKRVSE